LVFRKEEEGAFLFNPDDGAIKVLNGVGAFIWQLLDGKNTTEKICQQLEKNFSDEKVPQLKKDFEAFLAELQKMRLLESK